MNSKNINRTIWGMTLPILFSPLADLLARTRQLSTIGSQVLRRSAKYPLFLAAILLLASVEASALNSITCSGGHLYLEQSHPDGDICWATGLSCSGEWSHSWELVKKGESGNVSQSSQRRMLGDPAGAGGGQEIVTILLSLKESDLKLFYQAPSSIVASFKERKGWPTSKGTFKIPEGTLPTWLENLARQKSSRANAALNRARGYPPHGYPCLGCHPCPPDYCDNDNKSMKESDLAPVFVRQGYRNKDGKIVKVAKAAPDSIKRKKK